MNKVARILLLVGGLVLALLIGVLIGRGQRIQPTSEGNAAPAVQITTAPPPSADPAPPLPAALPAPPPAPVQAPQVQAPQPVAIAKPAPDLQVQEDAAAVGMTTHEPADQGGSQATTPAPKNTAVGRDSQPQPPSQPQG
jgi:hypothetical protein